MSLIYQALRQLQNDADTGDAERAPAAPVTPSATPAAPSRRKALLVVVALALVVTGLGAVWGARHLTDRLQPDGGLSHGQERRAVPVDPSSAVQAVPQPPPAIAPVAHAAYFPPERLAAGPPAPGEDSEGVAVIDAAQQDEAPSAPTDEVRPNDARQPRGDDAGNAFHVAAEGGVPAPREADTGAAGRDVPSVAIASIPTTAADGDHGDAPAARTATADWPAAAAGDRSARVDHVPPQWSAEQAALARASRAARARSARIHQLVGDLESAIAANPDDNGRIRALLDQLAQTQGADDAYVLKMRAYWRFQRGDLEAARVLFQQVADTDPGDLEAGINLALIEARSGQRPLALARLKQLRYAHPDNLQVADLLRRLQ